MKSNIKVTVKEGNKPGKTIVILAGVHGNEVCGVKAFDEIIPNLKIECGKVIFIYANLEAIKQNKRFVEKNLNRCFFKNQPLEIVNTLEGKTAKEITPYLDISDGLLDMHSSNNPETNPFIICDESQIDNARIFDPKIVTFNWDPFEPGSTDYYMNQLKKPAFCIECGYVTDISAIDVAKKAIFDFLIFNKNISGNISLNNDKKFLKIKRLFKNESNFFKKVRDFKDFEKVSGKFVIGYDGINPVYVFEGDIILFLKDTNKSNDECFLVAEETLLNKDKLNNLKEVSEDGK